MKKFKLYLLGFVILTFILVLTACVKTVQAEFTLSLEDHMLIGETQDIKIVVTSGDEKTIKENIVWAIDDESVATLVDGKVTALAEGFVNVSATYGKVTVDAFIVVEQARVMKYELNGGICKELKTELTSSEVYVLPTPTKEGFLFQGWYSNKSFSGNPVTEISSANASIKTLYAKWRSEDFVITYCLMVDGVDTDTEGYTKFTTDYTLISPDYDSNKYVFSGWYAERNLYNEITVLEKGYNKDIKVYGVLSLKTNKINVVLDTNGGTVTGDVRLSINIGTNDIPTPTKNNYTFIGWYKDYYMTIPADGPLYKDITLYALFTETYPVESLKILNTDVDIKRKEELELICSFNPVNPTVTDLIFESADSSIATVDQNGVVTGVKVGKVMIKVTSKSQTKAQASIEIEVYEPDYFEVSYDTKSYVEVGNKIRLNAKYHLRGAESVELVWSSADDTIATVDANGIVKGIADGFVKIKVAVKDDTTKFFEFGVTVISSSTSDAIRLLVENNVSNVYTVSNLPVGAGIPVYYTDVVGSVNNLLFKDYEVDRTWEPSQNAISSNHGGKMTSVEFITVHYTGNMAAGATGNANAGYFAQGGGGTSVHYVTGNDGIFSCLDDTLIGFHAGDGHSSESEIDWYPTGVMYKSTDSIYPTWGISANSKYTLNGQETIIDVPQRADGKVITEDKWINKMGFGYKIVNGEYYMAKTYWCYTQVSEGRLCNHGGNMNSIGIESAVNQGSDLWYTWQLTAQLVAHLMIQEDLPIQRVVGHHAFSAKNCPQPLLENELELWWQFIELVKAEYKYYTEFSDYSISLEVIDGADMLSSTGRVKNQDNEYHCLTYKATITNTKTKASETVTLSSMVEGLYSK